MGRALLLPPPSGLEAWRKETPLPLLTEAARAKCSPFGRSRGKEAPYNLVAARKRLESRVNQPSAPSLEGRGESWASSWHARGADFTTPPPSAATPSVCVCVYAHTLAGRKPESSSRLSLANSLPGICPPRAHVGSACPSSPACTRPRVGSETGGGDSGLVCTFQVSWGASEAGRNAPRLRNTPPRQIITRCRIWKLAAFWRRRWVGGWVADTLETRQSSAYDCH